MTGIYHVYAYYGSCGMGLLSTLVAPSLMSSTAASCSGGEAPTWLVVGLGLGLGLASCSGGEAPTSSAVTMNATSLSAATPRAQ